MLSAVVPFVEITVDYLHILCCFVIDSQLSCKDFIGHTWSVKIFGCKYLIRFGYVVYIE